MSQSGDSIFRRSMEHFTRENEEIKVAQVTERIARGGQAAAASVPSSVSGKKN